MDASDEITNKLDLNGQETLPGATRLVEIPQSDESLVWFVDSLPDSVEKEACRVLLEVSEYSAKVAGDEEAFGQWFGAIREGLSGRNNADRLVTHLVEVTNEYDIPHQFVFDFVKGPRRHFVLLEFPDFAELETCAYLCSSALLLSLAKVNGCGLDADQEVQAFCKFGVGDFLLQKLAFMVPQLNSKKIFMPVTEWMDRRLNLYDQTEPIEDELWKNLIQFQCSRIRDHLAEIESVCQKYRNGFGKVLNQWAIRNATLLKKINRNPLDNLRESIRLGKWDQAKVWVRQWLGFRAEAL